MKAIFLLLSTAALAQPYGMVSYRHTVMPDGSVVVTAHNKGSLAADCVFRVGKQAQEAVLSPFGDAKLTFSGVHETNVQFSCETAE